MTPTGTAATLDDLLAGAADRADRPAVSAPGSPPLTYGMLRGSVDRWTEALTTVGMDNTARVGLAMPSGPDLAVAMLAVAAGAICAPLRPDSPAAQLARDCADLRLDLLLVPADRVAELSTLELPVAGADPEGLASTRSRATGPRRAARPDDTALLLRTSGTTGRPKRVPLTHANLCHTARAVGRSLRLTDRDRCLNVMPLWHVHGFVAGLLASLAAGGSAACPAAFSPSAFAGWLADTGATWYSAAPAVHQAVLAAVPGGPPPHRLRFIRSASSALPGRVLTDLEAAFVVPVIEAYGMTEAAHEMTSNPLPPAARKPGSVGVATGAQVAIRDASGRALDPGAEGEIVVRGPGVFAGYEDDDGPAATATFVDGWFRTGDRGRLDRDGYLFITGRSKEMINRGGETIAPREIEDALLDHPDVVDALVFGIPHRTLGETVGAAVVPRTGAQMTETDLRRFLRHRLEPARIPVRVGVLAAIPRTATGKPRRAELARTLGERWASTGPVPPVPPDPPPSDPIARAVAWIWVELLDGRPVQPTASLAALGMDSLLATRAANRIEALFGVRVPPVEVFLSDSVAEQAALVQQWLTGSSATGPDGHGMEVR